VFVILGFHRKPHRLATIRSMCTVCQVRTTQEVASVRTRFRLFFIPVLPLPTTYRTTCTECGSSVTVSAERADLLLATAACLDEPELTDAPDAEGSFAA
jgi:hypothetical protein